MIKYSVSGASCDYNPHCCSVTYRYDYIPGKRIYHLGLRLIKKLKK